MNTVEIRIPYKKRIKKDYNWLRILKNLILKWSDVGGFLVETDSARNQFDLIWIQFVLESN